MQVMEVTFISPGPEGDLEEAGVLTGCGCPWGGGATPSLTDFEPLQYQGLSSPWAAYSLNLQCPEVQREF